HRGQHGCRMQDLGAEVGKFGGFIEADDLDAAGIGTEAWVGGHHAVDVGPDFDARGVQTGAKIAAEKSDRPRPMVVVMPARFEPINPPITGTLPASINGWTRLRRRSLVSSN